MNHGDVLVIGGTSDARAICQQLDAAGVRYTLSVATPTGERLAGDIRGRIRCGRMEWQQMAEWLRVLRTPRALQEQGCGYCVRAPAEPEAIRQLLTAERIAFRRLYRRGADGAWQEVEP